MIISSQFQPMADKLMYTLCFEKKLTVKELDKLCSDIGNYIHLDWLKYHAISNPLQYINEMMDSIKLVILQHENAIGIEFKIKEHILYKHQDVFYDFDDYIRRKIIKDGQFLNPKVSDDWDFLA